MTTCIAEFDDYPIHAERIIKQMDSWKELNPEFKATLYAIPSLMKKEHWDMVDKRPWLRTGVHGFNHRRAECRRRTSRFMKKQMDEIQNKPYDKICKPPFYGYGKRYIEIIAKMGYAVSCRHANDIYRWLSPMLCQGIRLYCKYEQPYKRMFGHPNNTPFMFIPQTKKENKIICQSSDKFIFSSDAAIPMSMIYLGSGEHNIAGFDNLDKHAKGATKWQWGERLPYSDNSVSFVLIQQSLMYAETEQYDDIFHEIYRVLCTGGIVLVKEDNPEKHIWRPIGRSGVKSHCCSGGVISSMMNAGLTINSIDSLQLVDKYPSLCNRVDKVNKGWIYLLEGEKKGGRR